MATLIYPTAIELHEIEQEITPRMEEGRLGLQLLPIENDDSHVVEWEQKDNYSGMQQVRGLNGDPKVVGKTGGKRFMFAPGVYGEFESIDEMELTKRRQWGSREQKITVDDLVRDAQEKLLMRRLNRIEYINWQVALAGTFLVPTSAEGAVPGSAAYRGSFPIQTFSAATVWSNLANSTPLADMRNMALLSRGKGTSFGTSAQIMMNRTMINYLLSNTNPNDLGMYRRDNAASFTGAQGLNTILRIAGVPEIVEYDEGDFLLDGGPWTLYIPNGKAVLVGKRKSGTAVGKYKCTRNANNESLAAGPYTKVIDDPNRVPRQPQVHDGHNGGPALEFPGSVVSCNI